MGQTVQAQQTARAEVGGGGAGISSRVLSLELENETWKPCRRGSQGQWGRARGPMARSSDSILREMRSHWSRGLCCCVGRDWRGRMEERGGRRAAGVTEAAVAGTREAASSPEHDPVAEPTDQLMGKDRVEGKGETKSCC